ncbi:hypothetical protein EIP86_011366 [Pleurotus ostreatoroseus]|nr:hypothetical protein EIP86_011366 [Pleurotus ostreatoroseus]
MAYLLLHRSLERRIWSNLVEPLRVHGASRTRKGESDSGSRVILVQDVDLVFKLKVGFVCKHLLIGGMRATGSKRQCTLPTWYEPAEESAVQRCRKDVGKKGKKSND